MGGSGSGDNQRMPHKKIVPNTNEQLINQPRVIKFAGISCRISKKGVSSTSKQHTLSGVFTSNNGHKKCPYLLRNEPVYTENYSGIISKRFKASTFVFGFISFWVPVNAAFQRAIKPVEEITGTEFPSVSQCRRLIQLGYP